MYVQNFEIDEYYACIFTKQTITPVNYINTENTIWLILQYLHLQIIYNNKYRIWSRDQPLGELFKMLFIS